MKYLKLAWIRMSERQKWGVLGVLYVALGALIWLGCRP